MNSVLDMPLFRATYIFHRSSASKLGLKNASERDHVAISHRSLSRLPLPVSYIMDPLFHSKPHGFQTRIIDCKPENMKTAIVFLAFVATAYGELFLLMT